MQSPSLYCFHIFKPYFRHALMFSKKIKAQNDNEEFHIMRTKGNVYMGLDHKHIPRLLLGEGLIERRSQQH